MEFWKADNPKIMFQVNVILSNRTWMMLCPSYYDSDSDDDNNDDETTEPESDTSDKAEADEATRDLPVTTTTVKPKPAARLRGNTGRLWPYTKVRAGVRALNGLFGGPLSNIIEFRTPEGGLLSSRVSKLPVPVAPTLVNSDAGFKKM